MAKEYKTGKWSPERLARWKAARWGTKAPKTIKNAPNSNGLEASKEAVSQ